MQSLNIKEYILLELHITQTRHSLSVSDKNVLFQHPSKMRKKIVCAQKKGAHYQCVNSHYAKFEYKGMNAVGITDYTN